MDKNSDFDLFVSVGSLGLSGAKSAVVVTDNRRSGSIWCRDIQVHTRRNAVGGTVAGRDTGCAFTVACKIFRKGRICGWTGTDRAGGMSGISRSNAAVWIQPVAAFCLRYCFVTASEGSQKYKNAVFNFPGSYLSDEAAWRRMK